MPLYNPSELHEFLNSLGISAKKSLSQNFLIDGNILRKIVECGDVIKDDFIFEIGPGPGALTEALLERGAHVLAVEKDRTFAKELLRLKTDNRLEVFQDDIMDFDIISQIQSRLSDERRAKVIANLPYHLTTPILSRLVPLNKLFSKLVVMVQEEVARRFVAEPSTSDYSSFTVFLNFYCTPKYAFKVSRKCFSPSPKVDSAIVVLDLKEPPQVDEEAFFMLTRTAFQHRRKMLRASLKELYPSSIITQSLETLGLDPLSRPENLSLDNFLNLFALLRK